MKLRKSPLKSLQQLLPVVVVTFTIAGPAQAATLYWDGPNNGDWNATNFNTQEDGLGVNPGATPGAADTAVLGITSLNTGAINIQAGSGARSTLGLVINTTGQVVYQNSVINNSRTLNIGSGGITMNANAGSFFITTGGRGVQVNLAASQTWANNGAVGSGLTLGEGSTNPSHTPLPTLNLNANTLTIDGSQNTTINRPVVGTGGIIKNGAGALTLDKVNTYTGATQMNLGTLNVNNALALQNSVLEHVAGSTVSNTSTVTLGGLSGSVNFGSGGLFETGTAVTALTLNTGSTTAATYSGNVAGALTITKTGTGTQVLGGNLTNTSIAIDDGRLDITGSSNTTAVTVGAAGGLGGEGSTTGAVTFSGGDIFVNATTNGAGNRFTAGNLNISGGVNLLFAVAPTAPGAFDVLSYTSLTTDGTLGGDVSADFTFGVPVSARGGSVTDNGAGLISANLGYAIRTWNNAGANGLFDVGTTANWVEGDNVYQQGDFVRFTDTAAGTVTINGANVAATDTIFSNTSGNDYTISSTAAEILSTTGGLSVTSSGNVTINSAVAGTGGIAHSGTGTVTLNGPNTFTGGVTVASGATLVTGANNGALGGVGSGLTLASGGQWNASGGDFSALGADSVTLAGTGTGGIGALVNTTNALTLGGLEIIGNTTISSDAALTINSALNVSGTNVTLTKVGAGALTLSGDASTSAANLSQFINNGGNLTLNNINALGTAGLVMNAGDLKFAAAGAFNSDLELNSAGLDVGGPNGNVVFADGTTLTMTQSATFPGTGLNDSFYFQGKIVGSGNIILGRSAGTGHQIGATADLTAYNGDFHLARTGPSAPTPFNINDGRILTQDLVIVNNDSTDAKTIGAISGNVEFAGNISLLENTDGAFNIRANTGHTVTISGAVADDGNGSGIDVIGTGGTVILTGTNTYGSGTRVESGCLIITDDLSIPASGVGTTVSADAGFGFDPSGLTAAEMKTIVDNITWAATSQLVFTVDSGTLVVAADLSGFDGDTIVLKGTGTLDLSGATVPGGVTYETPDGGTIIPAPAATPITVESITTGPGTISGLKVTLTFTASGNVDAYASETLAAGSWSLVAEDITSPSAVVEDNVASAKRFYVLVPANSGNPHP